MLTNAQAALQAAATLFGPGQKGSETSVVLDKAASFKMWLDQKDENDKKPS